MKAPIAALALTLLAGPAFAQSARVPTGIDVKGPACYYINPGETRVNVVRCFRDGSTAAVKRQVLGSSYSGTPGDATPSGDGGGTSGGAEGK